MKRNFILGAAVFLATLFVVSDVHAQWRRYPSRPYYGGPRVSVGIGGVFGMGRWGGYYGGPGVGVSVMLPPIVLGSRVHSLPPGARRVYYGGVTYYYRGNTYYRERERGDGYEIVEPPLGASLERLPSGARKRVINGQIYYEHNGNYYMSDDDLYIIVGKEGRLNTDEALRRRADSRDGNYEDEYDEGRYDSQRRRPNDSEEIIVRNANEAEARAGNRPAATATDEVYGSVGPQVGDRFENLPRNSKTIKVGGETQYESPSGTRYKEVLESGKTVYEVIKARED